MKKLLVPILLLIMFTPFYVNAESKYVYDILKDEAESGGLAREYTGEHRDSFTEEPCQKIYHWYAKNSTEGTAILDKNNVIFAGQCWQMIRTTDTGGVKMIYNGEAEDGKCLNTRGTHVGYASRTSQNLASNYWYGTDYIYDSTAKTFKVSGTTEQTTWNATTGPGLIGKYTCKSTSVDGSCTTLYLVESYYNTSSAYVIPLNSDSHYSQFGTLEFNVNYNSPSYVGYMYNTVYPYNSKTMTSRETMLSSSSLGTTYWYANSATWGTPTANQYNLDNPYQVSDTTDYPNLVGKYTFENATQTYTKTTVQYIAAVNNNTYYYIRLGNETGTTHDLSFYNYTYTYGESFTDNGNGTYTINSPTTVNRSDWYTSYSSVGANKYVCKNAVNDTCSELWYTTSTSNTDMTYIKVADVYKYAKSFSWDGSKYVLDNDTSTSFWNITDSTNRTSLNNAHYTCWNTTGECTTISYIYYTNGIDRMSYYINITNGKSVEDAKNEMLYNDNVNTTNSTIKSGVDAWYKQYLSDYSDYLEDTIFCNDRSQNNASTNGWNPDGGSLSTYMHFDGASDLSCPNDTDKFSVSNNKAQLTYKVGLMSYREMNLLNNSNSRTTGQSYWLASPRYFLKINAGEWKVGTGGGVSYFDVNSTFFGVRPAVSLTPGTRYLSGNGSKDNPYVIDLTNYYSINVEINNETEDLNVEINDLTQVAEGEIIKFKVTPIKGHKVTSIKIIDTANNEIEYTTTDKKEYTFTMPSSNVTIIPSYERVKNAVNVEDNKNTKELIIEVNDATAVVYEDTVRFKLEPESGYEVEDIDIIDEENNKIDYKKTNNINEYEFVMPDTDVIIKPKYRLIPTNSSNIINPNTGTGIYIIIIIMLVISSITYITIKRRKNYILN